MDKLTKNRMTYLLAHYEGAVAGKKQDAGDGMSAKRLFGSAINKYEHLASQKEGEERMAVLNEALKLAKRSEDNAKIYKLLNTVSRLIMDPEAAIQYVELTPGEISKTPIRNAILRTYSNALNGNFSYVYRVELDRDGFNRICALFDDSELGKLIIDSRDKQIGQGGVPMPDGNVAGVTVRFEYNYSGYLAISSTYAAQHRRYVENVINVYGTALDGILSGLKSLERLG